MEQLRGLGHVLLASLLALLTCALIAYVGLVTVAVQSEWPQPNWPAAIVISGIVVLWGLVIATPIVVVLAAPAYALLLRADRASFTTAAAIGIAPGAVMLLVSRR